MDNGTRFKNILERIPVVRHFALARTPERFLFVTFVVFVGFVYTDIYSYYMESNFVTAQAFWLIPIGLYVYTNARGT